MNGGEISDAEISPSVLQSLEKAYKFNILTSPLPIFGTSPIGLS